MRLNVRFTVWALIVFTESLARPTPNSFQGLCGLQTTFTGPRWQYVLIPPSFFTNVWLIAFSTDTDVHPRCTMVTQDILAHFLETKTTPPYAAVLRIDQKIREIDFTSAQSSVPNSPPSLLRSNSSVLYINGLKSILFMALHKTYFAHAVLRPTEDPIAGRFATSTHAV